MSDEKLFGMTPDGGSAACAKKDQRIRELEAKNESLKANRDWWLESCQMAQEHRDGANRQLETAETHIRELESENKRLTAELKNALEDIMNYTLNKRIGQYCND